MPSLVPLGRQQFIDEDGTPYAGGTVGFYIPGTLTLKNVYADAAGTVLLQNPVLLDSAGRAVVWGSGDYRQILQDRSGATIWDEVVRCALPDSAVSSFWSGLLSGNSLADFLSASGLQSYISTAISNISLMPGPTGPQGPQGAQGPIGPTGPQGPAGAAGQDASGSSPISVQTGHATSDSVGAFSINWPTPFAHNAITFNITPDDTTMWGGVVWVPQVWSNTAGGMVGGGGLSATGVAGALIITITQTSPSGDSSYTYTTDVPVPNVGFSWLVTGY